MHRKNDFNQSRKKKLKSENSITENNTRTNCEIKDDDKKKKFSKNFRIDSKIVKKKDTLLGSGTFGVVNEGIVKFEDGDVDVAIKTITLDKNYKWNDVLHILNLLEGILKVESRKNKKGIVKKNGFFDVVIKAHLAHL